ncbi:hypothetical protein V6N13_005533 [Hibiscus sabdariffa]|uniref:Uncharacterized protein n=1 Tax=Hibiscus sabdariffa TaxID=183260 RepID=A0ABR2EQI2_9ROSI
MATPATTTTTVSLRNLSGDTAMLVSTTYESAPAMIRSDAPLVSFQQNLSTSTPGSVMYDIGKLGTWMVSWTADNQVTIQILPAGASVTWKSIWDNLQPNYANITVTMPDGAKYNSKAEISSTGDAQILNAVILYIPN